MRTVIVDDEPAALERLERLLAKHREIELVGRAENGLQAVERIEALQPDLLLLDIELPGLSGFEVLQSVRDAAPLPLVIFVTGYDEHALAAFEANALAYLLKPVEAEKLAQAVDRAEKLSRAGRDTEREHVLEVARTTVKTIHHIVCRKHDRLLLVPPDEIFWFQVEDGIVKAKTANDSFWVNYQLSDLAASLPEDLFFRARREVLVNLAKIQEIRPYFKSSFLLTMSDTAHTQIPVSERQAPLFRQRLPGL